MTRCDRRGLTLIEMLITIVFLSLSVALVIPSMDSTGVLKVQLAARTIASDVAAMQTEAMAYQEPRGLYFGVTAEPDAGGEYRYSPGNGYAAFVPPGSGVATVETLWSLDLPMPETPDRPLWRDFSRSKYGGSLLSEASFDDVPMLVFDELGGPINPTTGAASAGGSLRVGSAAMAVVYEVRIAPMTGRVTIEEVGGGS